GDERILRYRTFCGRFRRAAQRATSQRQFVVRYSDCIYQRKARDPRNGKGFTGRPYFRRSVFCLGKEMIENGAVRQPPRPNPRPITSRARVSREEVASDRNREIKERRDICEIK